MDNIPELMTRHITLLHILAAVELQFIFVLKQNEVADGFIHDRKAVLVTVIIDAVDADNGRRCFTFFQQLFRNKIEKIVVTDFCGRE